MRGLPGGGGDPSVLDPATLSWPWPPSWSADHSFVPAMVVAFSCLVGGAAAAAAGAAGPSAFSSRGTLPPLSDLLRLRPPSEPPSIEVETDDSVSKGGLERGEGA